ncbi:MAG: electron transport complex subunit E [Lachnospiraceae bacterium]|nr:electron transport complex subunit E [Lachnospiraceae bacterium]
MKNKLKIFTNGLFKENPVLILLLGCCSVLAISVTVSGAIGMGLAMTFVLVCSNAVISLLRKVIPDKVRIPCYIVVIAAFVTLVQMVVEAYLPDLYESLGIFLALIVVNCIILGRAEMFASKNSIGDSILDGLGMGIGYTLVIVAMAVVRELLGSGTLLGYRIIPEGYQIGILVQTPGGFLMFGIFMAILIYVLGKHGKKFEPRIGCDGKCGACSENCRIRDVNETPAALKEQEVQS